MLHQVCVTLRGGWHTSLYLWPKVGRWRAHSFQRKAEEQWLRRHQTRSRMTNGYWSCWWNPKAWFYQWQHIINLMETKQTNHIWHISVSKAWIKFVRYFNEILRLKKSDFRTFQKCSHDDDTYRDNNNLHHYTKTSLQKWQSVVNVEPPGSSLKKR